MIDSLVASERFFHKVQHSILSSEGREDNDSSAMVRLMAVENLRGRFQIEPVEQTFKPRVLNLKGDINKGKQLARMTAKGDAVV